LRPGIRFEELRPARARDIARRLAIGRQLSPIRPPGAAPQEA
jgi:hypothetical protein